MRLFLKCFLMLAPALCLCSCRGIGLEDTRTAEPVSVTVKSSLAEENAYAIRHLEALAFRKGDGILEDFRAASEESVSLKLTADMPVEVIALANCTGDALRKVYDKESFSVVRTSFSDMEENGFVMSSGFMEFTAATDGGLELPMTRLACKISLWELKASFVTEELASLGVTLERAFLINVSTECGYDMNPLAVSWRNRSAIDADLSGFEKKAYCREFGIAVNGAAPIHLGTELFCYPNPVDNGIFADDVDEWCPRNTRLVLQLSVGGIQNYYSVSLPSMECGREYVIKSIELLGFGMEAPDLRMSRTAAAFETMVSGWEESDEKELVIN